MVQRRRHLADIQESAGSIPAGITHDSFVLALTAPCREGPPTRLVLAGSRARTNDSANNLRAGMPLEATDFCKVGVMGSTPMRSTTQRSGPLHNGAVHYTTERSTDKRKVAGYGLPGRTANACHLHGDEGSNPLPSADGSMVKRRSCLASNEMFQVQILVGLLVETP